MSGVQNMLDRWKSLNIDRAATDSLTATKEQIADKQKDQLLHGIRQDGEKIGTYKDQKYYAVKKYTINQLAGFGFMDWKLSGKLYEEIIVEITSEMVIITSLAEYTATLIENNGNPFGLTISSKINLINETLNRVFMEKIKSQLRL